MREAPKGLCWYRHPDGRLNTFLDNEGQHKRLTSQGWVKTSPQEEAALNTPPPVKPPKQFESGGIVAPPILGESQPEHGGFVSPNKSVFTQSGSGEKEPIKDDLVKESPNPTLEITDNLAGLPVKELRELAKALGIDPNQKRPELETAIKAHKNGI